MPKTNTHRRGFLEKGALAAAGMITAKSADAAVYSPESKVGPKADLVTIGALSCKGHLGSLWGRSSIRSKRSSARPA